MGSATNLCIVDDRVLQVSFPEFKDLQAEIAKVSAQIDVNEAILTRMIVRGRYLQYLGKTDDGKEVDVKEECIICFGTSEDTHATLLACGHVFCVVGVHLSRLTLLLPGL